MCIRDSTFRGLFHVRLDLYLDWSKIDPVAIVRARHDGEALHQIIKVIDPSLPMPPFLGGSNYIPKAPVQEIIDIISKNTQGGNDQIYQFNTVGTFFIIAHRN